jgi:two-component system CheB/CheR fusion protein
MDGVEAFLSRVPSDCGMSIVVLFPFERRRSNLLVELLGRWTSMAVRQAAEDVQIEPNHVYVIPPRVLLTVKHGRFRADDSAEPRASTAHADRFFSSLAAELGEDALAVVLAGKGGDGVAGLRTIRQHGGLTIAETVLSSRNDGMPQTAIEAGLVDVVLPAAEIPARLLAHVRQLRVARQENVDRRRGGIVPHLESICGQLYRGTGHDFGRYKEGTLLRRIQRRMQLLRVNDAADYVKLLDEKPEEVEALFKDLLIGVSHFFRDAEAFQTLEQEVVPCLFQDKSSESPLRIWCPGCASGEEPYSLAMLVQEYQESAGDHRPVQIFATDIDEELLTIARRGCYSSEIADHVSPERLEQFFTKEEGAYRTSKELRQMCVFSLHNLIKDPPFSSLDLISCRNLLIYLGAELQASLVPVFHYALRPGGYLFLGAAEGLTAHPELFASVEKRQRIFRRKEEVSRPFLEFPLLGRFHPRLPRRAGQDPLAATDAPSGVSQVFERMILRDFAPACALVNDQGEVLYVAGRTGRYLQFPAGTVSTNILDLADGHLRVELRTALYRAAQTRRKVTREDVPLELDGQIRRLCLTVRPLPGMAQESGLYAVILQEASARESVDVDLDEASPLPDESLVQQLENELRVAREDLQTAVEELQSANEELRAANEELTSTNEELQSANEELQTSKEELQSLNDELESVNARLNEKIQQLDVANSDLSNLFASTQIATIFLDRELRIKKFTPAATALFNLLDTDIGRPISDLTPRFAGGALFSDIRCVLADPTTIEREVYTDGDSRWFILRILPYRMSDNVVAGVVLTFVDITTLKEAEEARWQAAEQRRLAMEAAEMGTWEYRFDTREFHWDETSCSMFGVAASDRIGYEDILSLIHPEDRNAVDRELSRAIAGEDGGAFVNEFRVVRTDGSVAWISSHGHVYFEGEGESCHAVRFIGMSKDVSERRRSQDQARRWQRVFEDAGFALAYGNAANNTFLEVNPTFARQRGYTPAELVGRSLLDVYPPEMRAAVLQTVNILDRTEHFTFESVHLRKDGSRFPVVVEATMIKDAQGRPVSRVAYAQDISERKQAEKALRESEERYRSLFTGMSEGFAVHEILRDPSGAPCDYRFLEINPSFERLTGLKREEVVGRLMSEVLPNEDPYWLEVYGEVAITGHSVHFEHYASILKRHYEVHAYSPTPGQFATLFLDVTRRKLAEEERRRLETQMLHSQKLESLGVMAGGIAHDFNNILAGIVGYAELAQASLPDANRTAQCLQVVCKASQRAADLTRQMLAYAGKGRFVVEPVSLSQVARDMQEILAIAVSKKAVIQYDLAPDLPSIDADATQVRQIVMNLILNASESLGDQNGLITVTTRAVVCDSVSLASAQIGNDATPGVYVALEIADTGCGMEPQTMEKIFDPFYSTKFVGRGLGLAAVLGIVRGHHGVIIVSSQPGQGTLFRVLFPARGSAVLVSPAEPPPVPVTLQGSGTILIVDDEEIVRSSSEALVQSVGFTVLTASDGEQAIEVFGQHREQIVCVILDLTMPKMSGEEVFQELRRIDPDVRVILTSGYSEEEMCKRFAGQQVFGFVEKPASFDALVTKLQAIL